ncbi:hypothetical protein BC827DRAFT_805145 [Russula dissimulans]|nr:hypothetical protein BC827DRAFT_805145 [Russula dissimulans]
MFAAAATTTTLHQSKIQRAPQSAVVRTYSLATVVEMEADFRAALPPHPLFAVGMSIGLAPEGTRIQTLAIATRDRIFCLSLSKPPPPAQSRVLQKLFSDIQYLTGFEFPYAMVLLAHTLGSDISGYDLSTLTMQLNRGDITSPGNFINSRDPSAPVRSINERWDGGIKRNVADSNGIPNPNYALRAWFTAIAANMALNDLQSGQQLSTRFVDKPMLRCYVDLACRAIRLDLLRPRVQENEFSEVQTKRNGKITVHNTRFKTRIRASGQTLSRRT